MNRLSLKNRKNKNSHFNPQFATVFAVVTVLLAGWVVFIRNRSQGESIIPVETGTILPGEDSNKTSPEPTGSTEDKAPSSDNKEGNGSITSTPPSSGQTPHTPYGTFVNNHRPSLSGKNGIPSLMESVCQGTPGAFCEIVFTNDRKTKSLPEKKLDKNGAALWYWDVKEAGFSIGSWKISAISTLGDKTAKAIDEINLEVQE